MKNQLAITIGKGFVLVQRKRLQHVFIDRNMQITDRHVEDFIAKIFNTGRCEVHAGGSVRTYYQDQIERVIR